MLAIHHARATPSIAEQLATRLRRHAVRAAGGGAARVLRLAEAEAWTEAALELIAMEAPGWTLRRLAHEDGDWFCALSRRPDLPIELDDCAEAHNRELVFAVLDALLEAREKDGAAAEPAERPSGRTPPRTVVCDNFC